MLPRAELVQLVRPVSVPISLVSGTGMECDYDYDYGGDDVCGDGVGGHVLGYGLLILSEVKLKVIFSSCDFLFRSPFPHPLSALFQ